MLDFIEIQPGECWIGDCEKNQIPQKIIIEKPFKILKSTVTHKLWRHVMGGMYGNNSKFPWISPGSRLRGATWNNAKRFCTNLSKMEGKIYRLPYDYEYWFAKTSAGKDPFETVNRTPKNSSVENGLGFVSGILGEMFQNNFYGSMTERMFNIKNKYIKQDEKCLFLPLDCPSITQHCSIGLNEKARSKKTTFRIIEEE